METPQFTKKEAILPEAKILNYQELVDEIYKGQNLPQDERFLSTEKGGVFKYFELENLMGYDKERDNRVYPIIKIDKEIVALSELEKSSGEDNNFWIKFICVDPKYQNNGYAKSLLKKIFQFAKDNNYSLETSIYSDDGLEKIKKIIDRLREETGVIVLSRNNHFN